MKKEKFDFEKYANWCKEKHLDASESSNLELFKVEMEKVAQTSEKERKIAEQKDIFDLIAKHCGHKVKYDAECYDAIETVLEAILFATEMCSLGSKLNDTLEEYGM